MSDYWDKAEELFPYDSYYPSQEEGMKEVLDTCEDDGYVLLEGACGTGKTLLSLIPLISLVKNKKTKYERVVVATSVKQQQRAIEDDLRRVNSNLSEDEQVSALSIVGKSDLCPYVDSGTIGDREIYRECEELRNSTRELSRDSIRDVELSHLTRNAENEHENLSESLKTPEYPFSSRYIPKYQETETRYCPFYAGFLDALPDDKDVPPRRNDAIIFDVNNVGLVSSKDMLEKGAQSGMCPHAVMGETFEHVDVVIGNYYHLFDPQTVEQLTNVLLDEETLVVFDEAHNIVPRVRDLLSRSTTINTFGIAIQEIEDVLEITKYEEREIQDIRDNSEELSDLEKRVRQSIGSISFNIDSLEEFQTIVKKANLLINQSKYGRDEIEEWKSFLEQLVDAIGSILENSLDVPNEETTNIPLRPPETPKTDRISDWFSLVDGGRANLKRADAVTTSVKQVLTAVENEVSDIDKIPQFSVSTVGDFIRDWDELDNTQYFRCINVIPNDTPTQEQMLNEQASNRVELEIFNCIPQEEISKTLSKFGGGVLMSATLEPMDIYKEVVGVSNIDSKYDISTIQHGLSFPDENRMSYSVDAPKFKYSNRENPKDKLGKPNLNDVRREYADALADFVTETPGNVLISMPNYREAKWAGEILKEHPEAEFEKMIIDESSSSRETEQIKQEFFDADEAVLSTGARGTLTEGIDYKEEKLDGVICCGVPIENTSTVFARAVRSAYEDRFGEDNGYEYAFIVPAVRKARQAIGRLLRTESDKGVRVLMDRRYTSRDEWDSVREYMSKSEQDEFTDLNPELLGDRTREFWDFHNEK